MYHKVWKNWQKKYLGKKYIDVMKILRPKVGFFFDFQYVQKRIIQNELKWVIVITTLCSLTNFSLGYQISIRLQNGIKSRVGIWWSWRFRNLKLLTKRFIIHYTIVFRLFRLLNIILPLALNGCTTWKFFLYCRWNKCWLKMITQFQFGMQSFTLRTIRISSAFIPMDLIPILAYFESEH